MSQTATSNAPTASAAAPATSPAKPKRAKREGPPKSFSRSVAGGPAGKDLMQFNGVILKDGKVNSYITIREASADGKTTKSHRGGTQVYDTVEAAKAGFEAGVKAAVAKGWKERTRTAPTGNFTARPDEFSLTDIPAPRK